MLYPGRRSLYRLFIKAILSLRSTWSHDLYFLGSHSTVTDRSWEFFTGDDPTHGNVNYLSREDAQRKKLAFINNDGAVVLSVDATTQLSPNYIKRDS